MTLEQRFGGMEIIGITIIEGNHSEVTRKATLAYRLCALWEG